VGRSPTSGKTGPPGLIEKGRGELLCSYGVPIRCEDDDICGGDRPSCYPFPYEPVAIAAGQGGTRFHGKAMDGHISALSAFDPMAGGRRALAGSVRGAKKFVNSRRRFRDRMTLHRLREQRFEET
jgi:hypothetical protein